MPPHCFCHAGEFFYWLQKCLPMKPKQTSIKVGVWLYTVYNTGWSSLRLFSRRFYTHDLTFLHFPSRLQQKLVHTCKRKNNFVLRTTFRLWSSKNGEVSSARFVQPRISGDTHRNSNLVAGPRSGRSRVSLLESFRSEDEDEDEDEDEALCFRHNEIFKLFRLQLGRDAEVDILVPRGRAPFGQPQESRPLAILWPAPIRSCHWLVRCEHNKKW